MGVEAREQFKGDSGMEDSPLSRADHPLVKYAEAFTHYFDVIAERRSVVYHLRELAKASVLAKFLMEASVNLEDQWFDMADGVDTVGEADLVDDVPQLWNKRCYAQLRVQDGGMIDMEASLGVSTHGVYGGVQFGLDRFEVGAGAVAVSGVSTRVAPLSTARYIDQPHLVPFKGTGRAAARGVDLNLDQFNLSEAAQAAPAESVGSWGPSAVVGSAFWKQLGPDASSVFASEDAKLLRALFNPHLSDRRDEGEVFIPPDTSREYVERLSGLLEEEGTIREQRQELFLSDAFSMQKPGPLFPTSWAQSFEITKGQEPEEPCQTGLLHPRPDYMGEVQRFKQVLVSTVPSFDKRTEDGARFRVYEVGSLQVRTIQQHGGEEVIRAFFSTHALQETPAQDEDWSTSENNLVVRVTQYVETLEPAATKAVATERVRRPAPSQLRFYVVLETELGDSIVMEKRRDQAASWRENPAGLEARSSLARVTRSVDTSGSGITLKHFKGEIGAGDASQRSSESQRYAEEVYKLALAAWERSWSELSEPQAQAVKALGVSSAAEWFEGKAQVFGTRWQDLSRPQQEAVEALGFDEEAWAEMVAWSRERGDAAGQWRRSGPAPRGPALAS
uniref:Uncharacterized protein n=1 Tax=Alexandrium catenella TaxID=2925 RepID=A0A7S1MPA9_ALECA|mmetsp:Transcript_31037/g.84153  ORF Transcript_31037/g.84153 Transcript_31037/m.84153 type:complete len:618 (+) Transcript_31037:1-1854(+)